MKYFNRILFSSVFILFFISSSCALHETNITLNTTGSDLFTGYNKVEYYSFNIQNLGPDVVKNINVSIPSYISVVNEDPPPGWTALSTTSFVYFNTAFSGLEEQEHFNISLKTVLQEDKDTEWNISSGDENSYYYNTSVFSYFRTTPPSILFYSTDPLKLSISDEDGISTVMYRWENETTGPWTDMVYSDGFYTATLPDLEQDVYTIRAFANDSLGNGGEETTAYIVDSSPPDIIIYSPEATTYNTWDLFLNFTVSDNYDTLLYCTYRSDLETVPLGYVVANQPYSQRIVLSKDGSHIVYMTCYDSSNNEKQTEPVVFTVETTPDYEPPPQGYYPPETGGEEEISVQSSLLSIVLEPGTNRTIYLKLSNNLNQSVNVVMNATVFIEPYVYFPSGIIEMESNSIATVPIEISVDEDAVGGIYTGEIGIYTETSSKKVPIILEIAEELLTLIYSSINIIDDSLIMGEPVDLQVKLFNLGSTNPGNVVVSYILRKSDDSNIVFNRTEQRGLTGVSTYYETSFTLPQISEGYYLLEVSVQSGNYTDFSLSSFKVTEASIFTMELFGVKLYQILIMAFLFVLFFVVILKFSLYARDRIVEMRNAKKRVVQAVGNIPKEGPDSILVGEISETNQKAYFSTNELTKHVLVSGGTGAGKTVAAMTVVEEALMRGAGVVVFDPTSQWSGFSKQNSNTEMVSKLQKFNMKPKNFPTNIVEIDDSSQEFDINIESGNITVLVLNSLSSDELDKFVKNTLENFFSKTWQESEKLKLLLVFDEVHRLLPRYGGKRRGIPLIEKAVRECRKWGIGVIMVSQVLTDFKAAIRANIGTEIQMRTEFEGDIRRIKSKYGSDISSNLTKLSVGWGMVQNPEYNKGKPYFVNFRPTLHQPTSIPKENISRIREYSEKIDRIEKKLKTLEKQGIDTFAVKTELSLARVKLKNMQFSMLDAYLDSIDKKMSEME